MKNFKQIEQLIDVSCRAVHAMYMAWISAVSNREIKLEQWSDTCGKLNAIEKSVWARRERLTPLRTAIKRYQDFAKHEQSTSGRKVVITFRDEATQSVYAVDSEEAKQFERADLEEETL